MGHIVFFIAWFLVGWSIGGRERGASSREMRELVAQAVRSQPDEYSEAVLGRPNADYCRWIRAEDSWGGAIELAVLSAYYGLEIDVVDTQHGLIQKFGEDRCYAHRIMLIYDGIHYDPLFLEPFAVRIARFSSSCIGSSILDWRIIQTLFIKLFIRNLSHITSALDSQFTCVLDSALTWGILEPKINWALSLSVNRAAPTGHFSRRAMFRCCTRPKNWRPRRVPATSSPMSTVFSWSVWSARCCCRARLRPSDTPRKRATPASARSIRPHNTGLVLLFLSSMRLLSS